VSVPTLTVELGFLKLIHHHDTYPAPGANNGYPRLACGHPFTTQAGAIFKNAFRGALRGYNVGMNKVLLIAGVCPVVVFAGCGGSEPEPVAPVAVEAPPAIVPTPTPTPTVREPDITESQPSSKEIFEESDRNFQQGQDKAKIDIDRLRAEIQQEQRLIEMNRRDLDKTDRPSSRDALLRYIEGSERAILKKQAEIDDIQNRMSARR
jgi:hypothetical protein